MDRWEQLHAAISAAVRDQRIGQPRSLRLTVHVPGDRDAYESLRQKIGAAANEWFGGEARTAQSLGHDGATADLLTWPTGSTALISVSSGESGSFGGSLMLMGARGSLYHDFDGAAL